jgi:capsular exopolysaccharide synthesis family protein
MGEPGIPWARYRAAIWRYKWLVLLFTAVGAGIGVGVARRIRPTYDVHATLWLSDNRKSGDATRNLELVNNSSWIDLLRSYAILERVARRAGMEVSPALAADRPLFAGFAPRDSMRTGAFVLRVSESGESYSLRTLAAGLQLDSGQVGDSVGRSLGFAWAPSKDLLAPGSQHPFVVQTLRDAANDISARLTTVQPEGTSFIRLTLTGGDPKATAALLNMLTDEFITVSTDLKKRSVVEQSARLAEQSRAAEASLRSAEGALERFRVASVTLPSDATPVGGRGSASDPLLTRYLDEKTEYEALQRDRAVLEDGASRLRADENNIERVLALPMLASRAPEVRAAVLELQAKRNALQAARQQYTDEHRIVRDLRDAEQKLQNETIPRLAAARIEQMRRREAELQSSIGTTATTLAGIPPRTLEELRLRRNITLAENLFAKVQNEYESAGLAAAGMVADVSVLDPAVAPLRAPQGRAQELIALFATAGLFGGILLSLLLDAGDKRLRYREQVGEDMDLVVLGSLPRLRRRHKAHSIENAHLVEALRGIRVGVAYGLREQEPMQLTITSPNAGDGKSLVSTNLAISFAEAGYRTLLIDGDIRRGAQHETFGVQRRPGLMDALAAEVALDQVIIPTGIAGLSLIPCGTRYRQGPELLAGPGLAALLDRVKSHFDIIIIDSPPLSLGADALWESIAAGALALVLRMDASDRNLAKSALSSVDRLPIQVLGAILNDCAMGVENDYYSEYLTNENIDVDTAVPQRTSQVGIVTSGSH